VGEQVADGTACLHVACSRGQLAVVQTLEHGADGAGAMHTQCATHILHSSV